MKQTDKQDAYRYPWARVAALLAFCMATLIGLVNRLEPETILMRACVATAACGLMAYLLRSLIVSSLAYGTRSQGR